MKLLCMGDNHGDTSSLKKVIEETKKEEFDFIVHVGDITNTYYKGIENGIEQLKEIEKYFKKLSKRGKLVYIWGNRDKVPPKKHIKDHYKLDVGSYIPHRDTLNIGGQEFTQNINLVEKDTILVTHGFDTKLIDSFSGLAYFSGHVHVGQYKNNVLNTAFLYRDNSHGEKPMTGGYFIVKIKEGGIENVEPRLWNLKEVKCKKHKEKGVQYIPNHWKTECKFCYEEQKHKNKSIDFKKNIEPNQKGLEDYS